MVEQYGKYGKGSDLYEKWMDYKGARTDSVVSKDPTPRGPRSQFVLHNDYANSVSVTPTSMKKDTPIPVAPVTPEPQPQTPQPTVEKIVAIKATTKPVKPAPSLLHDHELHSRIQEEFGPFYAWVTNGRKDDITQKKIKQLLFSPK